MTYKRWDVVAVYFPFLEGDEAKKRPALIVSSDALYAAHGVYWAAMITTAKAGVRPEDIPITDATKVGLPADCVIRAPRLVTLSDLQISHRLGSLTPKDRNAVSALLKKYLP
ncbi:MAG: type II toxin-antitoxin system PemK/MazF family toxin [Proteobacteria bacterium]|nr:type II toxin-antitoxin system PemK/MazF family toxin [Pseudomonadota bacterium]